jgi:hypothetical protein
MASVCRNLLSSKNLDQHAMSLALALETYSHGTLTWYGDI